MSKSDQLVNKNIAHSLTGLQRDILVVVTGLDSPSGQEVKKEIEDSFYTQMHNPIIYNNLNDLADKDLIKKSETDGRTNEYTVTEKGIEVLKALREFKEQAINSEK